MPEKDQNDTATQADAAGNLARQDEDITPEQQEWFRLAGFTRAEWQRLVYARWRYRQGLLTDSPVEE